MTPKEELTITLNHIILIQGFDNFSMTDLAKLANVSRAKLYLYFKNKDDIVESVVGRHMEFLKKYPIPETAQDENLISTILMSLLLLGSTTAVFETELKQKYPRLYREFRHGYDSYLTDLNGYYQNAQKNGLIIDTISADFLLFQNKINIRGILNSVLNKQINLETGERYLKEYFTYQVHSLFISQNLVASEPIQELESEIINEYYDTYSIVNN